MGSQITGQTAIYGVIGDPITHSLSPMIHNYLAKSLQQDVIYVPFSLSPHQLRTGIEGAWVLGVQGLNVTIPHKETVINQLDHIDEFASQLGAVNTLKRTEKGYKGYNTDGDGLFQSLARHQVVLENKTIMIIGAGGAARAAAMMAAKKKAGRIYILNRTLQNAINLANHIQKFYDIDVQAYTLDQWDKIFNIDLCIQTTSIGMHPHIEVAPIEEPEFFSRIHTVLDVVYNPIQTKLLSLAEEAGCQTINGLEMLVFQAVRAYELWHETRVPMNLQEKVLDHVSQYFKPKDDQKL